VVDVHALRRDGALRRWAEARLVPKVLVATQGKVLEAVVDTEGAWLPSVPTVTVVAPPDRLWHVLAVLLAPPVVAHAAARYAGTALTSGSIKLSARQVGLLPLPVDRAAWDRAAALAEEIQGQAQGQGRGLADAGALAELGATMCAAYAVPDRGVLEWWRERL
jgi:hypothetical protein